MIIKNLKTITITINYNQINTQSVSIFLPFVPNYFKIKSASISETNDDADPQPTDKILLLKSSLYNNDTIIHFARKFNGFDEYCYTHYCDLKYKINSNFINSNYDFYLTNILGDVPDVIDESTIELALTLEFTDE